MHNLKEIRKDFDAFKKSLEKRNININFDRLKDLDIKNRELIQKKENLEKEKKEISKTKDESLFSKSKEISTSIEKVINQQYIIQEDLIKMNDKKQYVLTTMNFRKILPYQTEIFKYKSKFIRKILNLLVIS